ncbi:MAG TPA: CRISPR system precrRNA processing endoribonuclease RAMP protein Cas6 [Polyangiaceae bacterium LLY-WYZ-15_(1-7)]|nr:CRISPR system precrRNA processing endoribonuclease RAMP protein Cas6 [Polyangiaceae bacterium LLY-WYZ-15_(1-7)]HJL08277.1 CRISPR system precrRNA processing endoribonuclease RAMP protein Cas6 [Polyangiaceae bacterium LLY-WYZ-15_(1-7)]HJL35711.1 CRISPR system precrRNA processing endoribonuclease RAMP protein Cas6 [Polyangiaceae bacterium LLY-WYZ-15_(1-7)]HJL44876.1 CRISPR system precrRNA processing endoribonuclease RAMP protein Cas6 [Polyangiaceae bacterium LLY-WYZ-15_(1-7)]
MSLPFTPPPFVRLALTLRAATPLELPGWLGSTFHGALGQALRHRDAAETHAESPSAARWLRPHHAPLPAWLPVADVPPLALRPPSVAARRRHLSPGAPLRFELVALHRDPTSLTALLEALTTQLPELDFGRERQRVRVEALRSAGRPLLVDGALTDLPLRETVAPLQAPPTPRVLRFATHTPLVLRRDGALLERPRPYDLALAAARRLAALQAAYGEPPAEVHLVELAERLTRDLELVDGQWSPFREKRYSARQRRRHPVHGSLGGALLRGEVAPLAALLHAARPFGLGKGTALGLGAFDVSLSAD